MPTNERDTNTAQMRQYNIIGNTAYKDIADKQFFNLDTPTAEKLAATLTERNIPFSGRINGDKATLTVDKSEVERNADIFTEISEKPPEISPPSEEKADKPPERQSIKDRLKDITDGIEKGIKDLFQSDKYAE